MDLRRLSLSRLRADEYHGGSLVIPGDAVLRDCVSMGGQLLAFMGLPPWSTAYSPQTGMGESYEDEEGRMCARPWSGDKSSLGTIRLNMKGKSAGLNRKPRAEDGLQADFRGFSCSFGDSSGGRTCTCAGDSG